MSSVSLCLHMGQAFLPGFLRMSTAEGSTAMAGVSVVCAKLLIIDTTTCDVQWSSLYEIMLVFCNYKITHGHQPKMLTTITRKTMVFGAC